MRARLLGILAALALLLVIVTPVAATGGGIDTSKAEDIHVEFEAGLSCPFAVRWDTVTNHQLVLTYPVRPNGDQLVRTIGPARVRVSNVETGKGVTVSIYGPFDLLFRANGLIDVRGLGGVIGAYYPTDVGGPGMFYFQGVLHDVVDADFNVQSHSFKGKTRDLCAALA
jgi:hypothetical protein